MSMVSLWLFLHHCANDNFNGWQCYYSADRILWISYNISHIPNLNTISLLIDSTIGDMCHCREYPYHCVELLTMIIVTDVWILQFGEMNISHGPLFCMFGSQIQILVQLEINSAKYIA